MKPIARGEVLGLADYEAIREPFRSRVIDEKKRRRVQLGPCVSVLFENRDTVLLQIQEMLRTERITRAAAVDHEIETYNAVLPGECELSCTAMIEIADAPKRDAFLRDALRFERHLWLVSGRERIAAVPIERGNLDAVRTTAVHYLKFPLSPALCVSFQSGSPLGSTAIESDHPAYIARALVGPATLAELTLDFSS